jgi:hypothetical protein
MADLTWSAMYLNEWTGRGIRVAVVDSGIHAAHPHVGPVEDGAGIRSDGSVDCDFLDRLGHGTAVAAAIREKAPDAFIIPIKIFWQSLATGITSLVRAIDEACERQAAVINLSLGTSNPIHREVLAAAVERAGRRGATIVAALHDRGHQCLPGDLGGVIPVCLDWSCPRDTYRMVKAGGRSIIAASGYPRPMPGISQERNLKGISFAVANATGFVVRAMEAGGGDAGSMLAMLESGIPAGEVCGA